MIKQLKKFDTQTTPFIATKDWHLLNVQHQDLVLYERRSGSYVAGPPELDSSWNYTVIPDTFVALEFIDYSFGNSSGVLNTSCNIALEQQDHDPVIYEEGISGSGLFYPTDPQNLTGTYKRLVYHQILRAFYNNYYNPLKIFGLETFDFQTSEMQRYLSNAFKIFTLPQPNCGDKIQPGSVVFVDNAFDDNYAVTDDSKGNLFAAPNLFAKLQEIRHIENTIVDADLAFTCPDPIVSPPVGSLSLLANITSSTNYFTSGSCQSAPFTMSLNWTDPFNNESGFYIYIATKETPTSAWTDYNYALSTPANVTASRVYYNLPMVSASFYVVAWNALGFSELSNTASVYTTCSSDVITPWEAWADIWDTLNNNWETYL